MCFFKNHIICAMYFNHFVADNVRKHLLKSKHAHSTIYIKKYVMLKQMSK
jgi:hypothetical protein